MKYMIRLIKSLCGVMIVLMGASPARANLIGYMDTDSVRGNAHGTLVWTGGSGEADFWIGSEKIILQLGGPSQPPYVSPYYAGGDEEWIQGAMYIVTQFGTGAAYGGGGGGYFFPDVPSSAYNSSGAMGIPNHTPWGVVNWHIHWDMIMRWDGTKWSGTGTWFAQYNYLPVPDDVTGTAALLGISLAGMTFWVRRKARARVVLTSVD